MKIDLKQINDGLNVVNIALPQLAAAYAAYKLIWTALNPGKTEQDFLDHLTARSQHAVDASSAILMADGFVQDANGNWSKPVA